MDTLRIVKWPPLYLLYTATTFGFSIRHGPHHDAQKSSSTYLPRKSESFTTFPSTSGSEKSIAMAPTDVFLAFSILSIALTPNGDDRSAGVNLWRSASAVLTSMLYPSTHCLKASS